MVILPIPMTFLNKAGTITTKHCATMTDHVGDIGSLAPEVQKTTLIGETNGPKNKRARLTPVIDTQVRRSPRIQQGSNGFKSPGCPNKKCGSCTPPTMSTKVIKSLGEQFCRISSEKLVEGELTRGGEAKAPIGRKKTTGKSTKKRGNRVLLKDRYLRRLMQLIHDESHNLEISRNLFVNVAGHVWRKGRFISFVYQTQLCYCKGN